MVHFSSPLNINLIFFQMNMKYLAVGRVGAMGESGHIRHQQSRQEDTLP